MDEDYERKLTELLEAHDRREAEEKRKQQQRRAEGKEFLMDYERACREVIRPVMERTVSILETRGHEVRISYPDTTRVTDTELRFSVFARGLPAGDDDSQVPFLRFIAHPLLQLVTVDISLATAEQPDAVGPRETVQLSSVTTVFVEAQLLTLLDLVFGEQKRPRFAAPGRQEPQQAFPGRQAPTAWPVPRRKPVPPRQ